MRKNASEIYNNVVNTNIGELVSTRHRNGINYEYTITDALTEQGYKKVLIMNLFLIGENVKRILRNLRKSNHIKNQNITLSPEIYFITLGVMNRLTLTFIK